MATDASHRADFIRRLFAVIVSVGFANQIILMDWVKRGGLPVGPDLVHIVYLILGLLLIIQSWEYYFSTIEKRPLGRTVRFYVDIVIVFSYLMLLTFSNNIQPFLM